jgi:hypothetical protein
MTEIFTTRETVAIDQVTVSPLAHLERGLPGESQFRQTSDRTFASRGRRSR